ncbi:MAG TPA: hypothetical protein VFT34_04370 [Verrucomicrobiae bacterium]|nr:hypothetical protein [Verrucomicrobiae bacterium]
MKNVLLLAGSLAVIVASSLWIYFAHFAAPKINVPLHQAVGRVMAEETAKLLGNSGKIVVIAIDTPKTPELKVQLEEFEKALKSFSGISVAKSYMLETEDKPKYGAGSGISARRYVRIVNKNTTADAIVSFVGAPELKEDEIRELQARPKLIVEARSADKLKRLFDQHLLHVAIVSRFQFPAPVEGNPGTLRQWFDKRFQIVTAESAVTVPASGAE